MSMLTGPDQLQPVPAAPVPVRAARYAVHRVDDQKHIDEPRRHIGGHRPRRPPEHRRQLDHRERRVREAPRRAAVLDGVAETTSRIADRGRQRHGAARRATAAWRYGFAPRADVGRCREARPALHLAQLWIINLRRRERQDVMTYLAD